MVKEKGCDGSPPSWETVNPRNLKVSTEEAALLSVVMGGSVGLQSTVISTLLSLFIS